MPQPRSNFIEPCLPSPADKPPSLLTRNGNDWSSRFPLVVEAVNHLKVLRYRSGRSPDWLKFKNPLAPAVKREAEEDWGR